MATFLGWLTPSGARAADDVKACIGAFDDGQGARSKGELVHARELLIACTQESCPAVIREDCAGVLREVEAALPTVVFAADDGRGQELVDVRVTEADRALTDRLDGSAMRVDPGPHVFRFERAGTPAVVVRDVAHEGEKNRMVRAHLMAPAPAAVTAEPRRGAVGYVLPALFAAGAIAALAVAVDTRVAYQRRVDALRGSCAPTCAEADRDDLSSRVVTANVALALGLGSAVLAGVSYWLLTPRAATPRAALVW